MHTDDRASDLAELVARVRALPREGGRRILVGIAGSPGSGKTTLALDLVALLGEDAAYLPMDGFHLANATLDRLCNHDRKGAPDTFDARGFVALLDRVRSDVAHTVYAPGFDRAVDEGVAGTIAIEPHHAIVVVEGNYLLVDSGDWAAVADLLDERWFCATPDAVRLERLVDRHTRHGRSPAAALAWARDVDGANAQLIERTAARADLRVSGEDAAVLD